MFHPDRSSMVCITPVRIALAAPAVSAAPHAPRPWWRRSSRSLMQQRLLALPLLLAGLLASALTLAQPVATASAPLLYIGQQNLPRALSFEGTTIGGLSGLDRDDAGHFFALSDDRSQNGPARFYTLTIDLARFQRSNAAGMDGIRFTGVHRLRTLVGGVYPPLGVDPEGIRYDPKSRRLFWTDEGRRSAASVLRPALREMTLTGEWVRDLPLPAPFLPSGSSAGNQPGDSGVRDNLSLESLAFDPVRRVAWIASENALLQDGPASNPKQSTPVRLQAIEVDSGRAGPAHVYMIDPIVVPALVPGVFTTNGLTEVLVLGEGEFLMVERSFTPLSNNSIRLYHASSRGATDVAALPALDGAMWQPMRKRLLLDLGTLVNDDGSGVIPDNIEAVSWGPLSAAGRPTLILLSDDNFSATQVTQFIALEVVGPLTDPSEAAR